MSIDLSTLSQITNVNDMTDDELVKNLRQLNKSNTILEMENLVFENFLLKVDPKLLLGIQAILDQAEKIQGQLLNISLSLSDGLRLSKSMGSVSSSHSRVSGGSLGESIKRISLATKIDLLSKERESYLNSVEEFYATIKVKRNNLRAELEEINTRIAETLEARGIFETSIVRDAVDPVTQRIPAEKTTRYMEEWIKCADSTIEKLRLRTCTLKYKKIYLQNQLKLKMELGESLHPVDFDQLQIDHRVLNKKIEQKNVDLLDLKKKSGDANLILSKNKRLLLEQLKTLNGISKKIQQKEKIRIELHKEIIKVDKEAKLSSEKLNKLEKLDEKYVVPDLIDYIKQKHELSQLNHSIKIWTRRNAIQKSALDTCIKTMKRLTQRYYEDPEWFNAPEKKIDEDNYS